MTSQFRQSVLIVLWSSVVFVLAALVAALVGRGFTAGPRRTVRPATR